MHTEAQIKRAIRPLIELYGELTTTELKQKLNEVLEFDDEDLEQSETRKKEYKIFKRIGNIVSHQDSKKFVYQEGFMVDKSSRPARFIATTGLYGKEKPISKSEINLRKTNTTRAIYKIDWKLQNERRSELGAMGEEFVFEYERDYVKKIDPNSCDKVIHLSASQGDGFGYDILSIDKSGETVFIEVKTTESEVNTPFYMSINEKTFFENKNQKNVFIYRVYNFNKNTRHGKILKISATDLIKNYNFDPISFKVTYKKNNNTGDLHD